MAICAVPDSSGLLHLVDVTTLAECTGYVLVTPQDKIAFLERIFDPAFLSPADYEMLFSLGLSTPVLAYLVSWAFQTVISFISKD